MLTKRLTIVIVAYNSSRIIYDCLTSIAENNDIGEDLEVIVVDNNSIDSADTEKIVKSSPLNVRFVSNEKNGGYGQGNNLGIKGASSPIIMIMNPDVRLIHPIFQYVINRFKDNNFGLIGGQQYERIGKKRLSYLPVYSSPFYLFMYYIARLSHSYFSKYQYIHGACFFIRKNLIEQIGYFDENIFLYGEEGDIHYRIRNFSRYKIIFDTRISYIHPMESREYDPHITQIYLKSAFHKWQKQNKSIKKSLYDLIISTKLIIMVDFIKHLKLNKDLLKELEIYKSAYRSLIDSKKETSSE